MDRFEAFSAFADNATFNIYIPVWIDLKLSKKALIASIVLIFTFQYG